MNQYDESNSLPIAYFPALKQKQQKNLLRGFWIFSLGLFIYQIFLTENQSITSNIAAFLITISALLPAYLWCSGKAQGMPIFPCYALTFISTYALPLITNHPVTYTYSLNNQLFASITVSLFLLIGTFVWFKFVKSAPKSRTYYRALNNKKSDKYLLLIQAISIIFSFANNGGWILVDNGVFSAVRSAILGLNALSAFVLAYRLGSKELSTWQSQLFIVLITVSMLTNNVSLTLVGAVSTFIAATMAFIIGGKKIPILPIIIFIICFAMLHYGKAEMRAKYWQPGIHIQPWEYTTFYSEWLGHSFDYLSNRNYLSQSQQKSSILERSSVVQMILLAQEKSPEHIPYLYGKTYSILPELIIPRYFNNTKIRSHEGTAILNVHYGLQTYKQSLTTTIGWDLVSEAYANFGLIGCGGIAMFLGALYGQFTRWSIDAPILSIQSLFSVLLMTFSFQTEWTAGVFFASFFQSSVVLLGIAVFLMKTYKKINFPILPQQLGARY